MAQPRRGSLVDRFSQRSPAFQLRRYAFTNSLPLSVLSDFEEFAVYDDRVKPDQRDSAAVARILYVPCTEYVERWDEIANVFSRDAVLKGGFDHFAEANKAKRDNECTWTWAGLGTDAQSFSAWKGRPTNLRAVLRSVFPS